MYLLYDVCQKTLFYIKLSMLGRCLSSRMHEHFASTGTKRSPNQNSPYLYLENLFITFTCFSHTLLVAHLVRPGLVTYLKLAMHRVCDGSDVTILTKNFSLYSNTHIELGTGVWNNPGVYLVQRE